MGKHAVVWMFDFMTSLTLWGNALQQTFDCRREMDHACAKEFSTIHSVFNKTVVSVLANGDQGIANALPVAGHQKMRHWGLAVS
jgi:hypothetical protein